ncbi:exocyst complex component EXO70B2-like [Lolium rigidum]|uniref:exocyst complex component EXO70B2-like n=1 Tax=Lolium rigidum TaxID=89674 RepID=UPI001F5DF485|nr:exocyst complex component EXO70B2-like [Lolium rigidum]
MAGLTAETTRLASIHLASVPEETSSCFAELEHQSYRDSIRSVAWPECLISWGWGLSSQYRQSGSSYSSISGTSSSYMSNISGYSPGSPSAGAADLGVEELTEIAHKMVSDGYTQRMVQAFVSNGEQDGSLKTWFAELDIDWVFQLSDKSRDDCGHQVGDKSASPSRLQELVERWSRALIIIVASVKELVAAVHETPTVGQFGKASISAMLVFVDAIVHTDDAEKLLAMLHVYICISNASHNISTMQVTSSDAQMIFNEIGALLERKGNKLVGSLSKVMSDVKYTLMKDKGRWTIDTRDSWAITAGGGEVHNKTRLMMDYIVLMRKSHASARNSGQIHDAAKIRDLLRETIDYLNDLLVRKSKMCTDPSLGYMFLLNNSYYVAQVCKALISLNVYLPCAHHHGLKLRPECEKYMDSYIEISWGQVMSCLSESNFPRLLRRRINNSSLAKFQSAFHKTCMTQRFWKVPDPQLRHLLRKTIAKRVIPGYRDYLKEHPELEKQVSGGRNCPEALEEMLGQLFEG